MKKTRRTLLLITFLVIVFFMVMIMTKQQYEQQLHDAMKKNDVAQVADVCLDWYKEGTAEGNFAYWFSLAWAHTQNGKMKAAKYNLTRAAAIMWNTIVQVSTALPMVFLGPRCIYQCIDGQLELLSGNCPKACPEQGGECLNEGGLVSMGCPA